MIFRQLEREDLPKVILYREALLESQPNKRLVQISVSKNQGKVIPTTQFIAINEEGEIVGMLNVRKALDHYLLETSGHIGYNVHPAYRRQGIATFMLRKALVYCQELGMDKVLITCLEENEASRKTILKCGGVYVDTLHLNHQKIERYWIHL